MQKSQKTYTAECKREAVQLAQTSGKPIAQGARELGISDSSIHQWRKELAEHGNSSIPRLNNLTSSLNNPSPLVSQLTQGVGMQVAEAATKFASLYQSVFRSTQLVNEAITNIAQILNRNLAIPKAITQELFASLPNATEWEELLKESAEANLAFAQAGYSFLDHLVSFSSIR